MRLSRWNSIASELIPGPRHPASVGFRSHGVEGGNQLPLWWQARISRLDAWCSLHQWVLVPLLLTLMCVPLWSSLGDHGFNGRSDVRYAVIAQDMASSGDWLVPRYMGAVHLTKPPLVYWLEAGSIKLLGHTYLAVRLPAVICGTLALLVLFWFARRMLRVREALFACGLYAVMPMTIFPARMAVTDSELNLCWLVVLCAGYLMRIEPGRRRWTLLFWGGASIGMLAKGPVMFIPLGIVVVWWIICSDKGLSMRAVTRCMLALLLAMLPTLLWALAVMLIRPEAAGVWWHETFDRVTGSGDHARPLWFFIPVLLVGCFPCSAMLLLPGVNLRWRQVWGNLRRGDFIGYLGWCVAVPFVVFSLISGKLPSYLLPICAPLAMLSACVLARWFDEGFPRSVAGMRQPEVRWALMVGTVLFMLTATGGIWYLYGPRGLIWGSGLVIASIASVLMVMGWGARLLRPAMMACFIGAWALAWVSLGEGEDEVLSQTSSIPVERRVFGPSGWTGRTAVYELDDAMIYWDRDGDLERFDSPSALARGLDADLGEPLLVLTDARRWDALETDSPGLFRRGRVVGYWNQWPGAPERYLVLYNRAP